MGYISNFHHLFQSTLPQRERHISILLLHAGKDFNPRSHKGSDTMGPNSECSFLISIHAPTKGATGKKVDWQPLMKFQSTLPQRERLEPFFGSGAILFISIHAPTKGATCNGTSFIFLPEFQSTLPQRERQQYCTK